MSQPSATVLLRGDNAQLRQSLQQGQSMVQGWSSSTSGMLKAAGTTMAGYFTARAAVSFVGNSIAAAQESIQSQKKLEAVIAATGGSAGFTADQLSQYASELQKLTNFEDDATVSAMAVLATFREIKGDTFKEATQAAMDMAAVMGTDLQSAILQIGKALNDPTAGMTALSRAGVSFTASQKEQIKVLQESGDLLGAQKIILAELKGEFGGAAEAMADPAIQLKNAWGDVKELIGGAVLPTVKELAEFLKGDLTSGADQITASLQPTADVMRDVSALLGELSGNGEEFSLIGSLIEEAFRPLNEALSTARNLGMAFSNLAGHIAESAAKLGELTGGDKDRIATLRIYAEGFKRGDDRVASPPRDTKQTPAEKTTRPPGAKATSVADEADATVRPAVPTSRPANRETGGVTGFLGESAVKAIRMPGAYGMAGFLRDAGAKLAAHISPPPAPVTAVPASQSHAASQPRLNVKGQLPPGALRPQDTDDFMTVEATKAKEVLDGMLAGFADQARLAGMDKMVVTLDKLKQAGADAIQLDKALSDMLDAEALTKQAEDAKRMDDYLKHVADSLAAIDMTPAQKAVAGLNKDSPSFGFAQEQTRKLQDADRRKSLAEAGQSPLDAYQKSVAEFKDLFDPQDETRIRGIKAAHDSLLQSMGIEKDAADEFRERISALGKAFISGSISEEERERGKAAAQKAMEGSLGIDPTANEQFQEQIRKLDSALESGLDPAKYQRGVDAAQKQLRGRLGIEDPLADFRDRIGELRAAMEGGSITQDTFRDEVERGRESFDQPDFKPAFEGADQLWKRITLAGAGEPDDKGLKAAERSAKANEEAAKALANIDKKTPAQPPVTATSGPARFGA